MSATKTAYKNLVGGEWVDAASGETMEVINPATGETIAEVPRCSAEDVDRAVAAANTALPGWLDSTPKERSELLHKLADVLDANAEELAQLESAERRQAADGVARRDAVLGRQPALLRRCRAQPRGEVGRRVHHGLHVDDPARAARDRRRYLPVELPADDGDLEARPGDRGRQRPDPQAVGADAALAAPLRAARAGGDPCRRAERRHRRRRAGRRASRRPSRRAARLAHGRRGDGQGDRAERGRHVEARPPRARRQGADGHLRRRRSEGGGRGHPPRGLLELRAGLHRRLARHRRAEDLRQAARGARAAGRVAEGRRSDGERRDRDGLRHLPVAAGADPRLPRAREGSDGADRRRNERLEADSSCSRRWSST